MGAYIRAIKTARETTYRIYLNTSNDIIKGSLMYRTVQSLMEIYVYVLGIEYNYFICQIP